MTGGRIERDGIGLHYDEAGSGPPVLFGHGLGADATQVAEIYPAVPATRRITLACRAHGQSDVGPVGALSISTFADDLAFVADQLGVRRAVVGGISMGAAVALRLAVRRPELASGLILARPAWLFGRAPANMQPYAMVGELLAGRDRQAARAAFEGSAVASRLARVAPDNLASLRTFFERPSPAITAALLIAIASDGPGVDEAEARGLAIPVLVIGHDDDLVHPLAYARRLAAIIPGARLVQITSKVVHRGRYVSEFRSALAAFLTDIL